jgi:hypothetical protein
MTSASDIDLAAAMEQETRNPEAAANVRTLFNALAMPLPPRDAFTKTVDGGMLVFLNDPACVMRIVCTRDIPHAVLHDHPLILQPLGSRMAGNIRVDINPGIHCPVAADVPDRLRAALANDNIRLVDDKTLNCGVLPGLPAGDDAPVVLDLGAVRKLHGSFKDAMRAAMGYVPPPRTDRDDIQARHYAPLRAAFARAWPEKAALPDAQKIQEFWDQCRAFKIAGKLVTSWLTDTWKAEAADWLKDAWFEEPNGYKNAERGSLLYQECWETARKPAWQP